MNRATRKIAPWHPEAIVLEKLPGIWVRFAKILFVQQAPLPAPQGGLNCLRSDDGAFRLVPP
jgi:hypothetical protein